MKVVQDLPPTTRYGTLALDLEIYGMNPRQLHRPSGQFASLGISDGKTVWMIEREAQIEKALHRIHGCQWVFHNADFDLRHLRRWADVPMRTTDKYWDTLLVEKLLWGGWYDQFGLRDLARRYLNVYVSKESRDEFSKAHEMSPDMMAYAARDPYLTYKIYEKQRPLLEADSGSHYVWHNIDGPALWAFIDFAGITLNVRKWRALTEKWKGICAEIAAKYPQTNLNAPGQVKELLHRCKIKVPNTLEATLTPYKGHPVVDDLLTYREAQARSDRYGDNILDMVEADGKLRAGFKVTQAETGRTACDGPNLQNQPNEFDYRDCYEAPVGERICAYDYAKQEPNVTAQISQDPELLKCLRAGEDVHLNAVRNIYGDQTIQKKGPDGRNTDEYHVGKTLNLGLSYGLTASGLAARTGKPVEECERLVKAYFNTYRGMRTYIDRTRFESERDGFVRSPAGRRIWQNWYGYPARNSSINARIQAGGADMIKRSIVLLHTRYVGEYFPVVGPIHDELLAQCQASEVKRLSKNMDWAMTTAYREICPDVNPKYIYDVSIGKSWAEKG